MILWINMTNIIIVNAKYCLCLKVYTPASSGSSSSLTAPSQNTYEQSLQQIADAMALADVSPSSNDSTNESSSQQLVYECPVCFKTVTSKDSINRHLLYHSLNEYYEYDLTCLNCSKQLSPAQNLAECLLHTREMRSHRLNVNYYKYVLSGSGMPVVSCVLCTYEANNLLDCVSHLMFDHFAYDTQTVRMKRFVSAMLAAAAAAANTTTGLYINTNYQTCIDSILGSLSPTGGAAGSSAQSKSNLRINSLKSNSLLLNQSNKLTLSTKLEQQQQFNFNPELVAYFNTAFPSLINELIVSLISAVIAASAAAAASSATSTNPQLAGQKSPTVQPSVNKPDTFFQDVKCFKCGKFSTKLKQSLFRHLSSEHQFDARELEKLYDLHIQQQLQVIDEQNLVEKYEKLQQEIGLNQQALFKEAKEKNEQQQREILIQQQQQQQQVTEVVTLQPADGDSVSTTTTTSYTLADTGQVQQLDNLTTSNAVTTTTGNELMVPIVASTTTATVAKASASPAPMANPPAAQIVQHSPQTVPNNTNTRHG